MGPAPFIAEASNRWRKWLSRWTKPGETVISRLRGIFPRPTPTAPHLILGREGEKMAARHLRRHKYKILLRNFRGAKGGEIDLVCRHGDTLVFVEVKTRSSEDFGRPMDAVDRKKRFRIIKGAMTWLRMLDLPDINFRFDVVEVLVSEPPEIRVIENAFGLPSNYYY